MINSVEVQKKKISEVRNTTPINIDKAESKTRSSIGGLKG